ncbi:LXG domain-containing protein [Alkalihalobacillus clausii]|uniref:LXG domain-containing protein n=1 Tax=Shouchella clausii TaxID=79880 RepID=UPI0020405442|nr:LXG domain-containing protein [Shouchella clausii]MCM3548471.1 LXG domain-containing protein [Shouchella clausii]
MILDTNELITEIERSIEQKRDHRDQLQTLQSKVEAICQLETLQGEGGAAIKDYFTTLHLPVLLFFQQFIETHISQLETVKDNLLSYDGDANTLVRTEFLNEVKMDLNRVINYTRDSANIINSAYESVSDLIHTGRWESSALTDKAREARGQIEDAEDHLEETDQNNQTVLETSKATLEHLEALVRKVEGWTTKEAMLSQTTLSDISAYFQEGEAVLSLLGVDHMNDLLDKMLVGVDGEGLTDVEHALLYHYLHREVIQGVTSLVKEDTAGLQERLNYEVLVSDDALAKEIMIMEFYIYAPAVNPALSNDPEEQAMIQAYTSTLRNHQASIAHIRKDHNHLELEGNPLRAFVSKLEVKQEGNASVSIHSRLAFDLMGSSAAIPHAQWIERKVSPDVDEGTLKQHGMTKEAYIKEGHHLLEPGIVQSASEVTHYRGQSAGFEFGRIHREEREEDLQNFTANFVIGKVVDATVGKAVDAAVTAIKIPGFVIKAGNIVMMVPEHNAEKSEEERQINGEKTMEAAKLLKMEVTESQRMEMRAQPEPEIQLHPTQHTEEILKRWEEKAGEIEMIEYPVEAVKNNEWDEVYDALLEINYTDGIRQEDYDYILGSKD